MLITKRTENMTFIKFTSIDKFADAWKMMQRQEIGQLQYRSKIKLHGTNAGVRIVGGQPFYQKRTADVTPLADNAGFASFAYTVDWKIDEDVIIYGEWAGKGVQKSDAVSSIPVKTLFVFAVKKDEYMITEPAAIREYVPYHPQIVILPWFDEPTTLDINNVSSAKALSERLNVDVEQIGSEDPFIKEHFGISGVGEGLVVSPYSETGSVPLWLYNTYTFKVKSDAHLVQKTKGINSSIYIEIPGSVREFCDQFVTDNRCEQMVQEHLEGSYTMRGMGTFLKTINADILKESRNEFAELGVEWKMVAKEINKRAVKWFKSKNTV